VTINNVTQSNVVNSNPPATTPAITNLTRTKVNVEAQYQTLVAGIVANLSSETSLPIDGGTYTIADLVSRFQDWIAAAEKAKASKNIWHSDVQSEREILAAVSPLLKGVQRYVEARYGEDSSKLAEFGFLPRKPRKVSADTKAASAAKAKATRAARKAATQNAGKATTSPNPATAPTAATSAPAVAPAAAASPAVGARPTTGGAS
jgi:hypothetical protein